MTRSDGKRFRQVLGKKIKALRIAKGMTQVELARAMGFTSTGAISQVESGLRGLSYDSIVNAARALDVHPVILMMAYDIELEDLELISSMIRLLEKRSGQPEQVDGVIKELRAVLRGSLPGSLAGGETYDMNDAMT